MVLKIAFLILVALSGTALAQFTTVGAGRMGSGAPPPACTQGKLQWNGNCNTVFKMRLL